MVSMEEGSMHPGEREQQKTNIAVGGVVWTVLGALGEVWTLTSLADQRRESTRWPRDFSNVFKHELGLKL